MQEQLFDCMDDLLEIDSATPEVAELLTEVCVATCYNNSIVDTNYISGVHWW